jgi:hypothetical protein
MSYQRAMVKSGPDCPFLYRGARTGYEYIINDQNKLHPVHDAEMIADENHIND